MFTHTLLLVNTDNVPIRNYIAEYLVNDLTSDIQYKIRVAADNEFDQEEFLRTKPIRIKEQNSKLNLQKKIIFLF